MNTVKITLMHWNDYQNASSELEVKTGFFLICVFFFFSQLVRFWWRKDNSRFRLLFLKLHSYIKHHENASVNTSKYLMLH